MQTQAIMNCLTKHNGNGNDWSRIKTVNQTEAAGAPCGFFTFSPLK
jgi:hypothetical protein